MPGLCYQALTKCKFCKSFPLIFIQNDGRWEFRSALPSATRIGASRKLALAYNHLCIPQIFLILVRGSFRTECGAMVQRLARSLCKAKMGVRFRLALQSFPTE